MPKALIILTSHDRLGNTGTPTGFYWEELAAPYWILSDAGWQVELASVQGGNPPADPSSATDETMTDEVRRFMADDAAMNRLAHTEKLDEIDVSGCDIVYLPGGHGTMWDLPESQALGQLLASAWDKGAVIGAVCHGPAGLLSARLPSGKPLVDGRRVAGFTNSEEEAAGLTGTVPFPLEDQLKAQGARHEKGPDWQPFALADGRLVTGQNPASSAQVAQLMLQAAGQPAIR
ncbi:type 1 glutamine amidotransferase domain-containing protein [Paracoccus liaowanqingii]|uniref:Type 1 glutamine amidotransferase domain-containing protein n=1 Tax=Paracoccus liaowanqingii TaxID=2560053 RepID=A0A4Z1CRN4_9RHOB|nr:type 1 glutamine amidotransferase domain-containing protein [Paracoccus liaowanqingii]TGN67780.1 type 1 glutamine amidotransferase domain-containing protein [Paracoccus liaowanqingii]